MPCRKFLQLPEAEEEKMVQLFKDGNVDMRIILVPSLLNLQTLVRIQFQKVKICSF